MTGTEAVEDDTEVCTTLFNVTTTDLTWDVFSSTAEGTQGSDSS